MRSAAPPAGARAGAYDAPFTITTTATAGALSVVSYNLYQDLPPVEWPLDTASPEALAALARDCGAVHAPFEVAPGEWAIEGPVRGVARLRDLRKSVQLTLRRTCGSVPQPTYALMCASESVTVPVTAVAHWLHLQIAMGLLSEYRVQRLRTLPAGSAFACPMSEPDVAREECDVCCACLPADLPPAVSTEVLNTQVHVMTPTKPFPRTSKAQVQRMYSSWPPPSHWLRSLPTEAELLARGAPMELLKTIFYMPLAVVEVSDGPVPPAMTVAIRGERYVRFARKYLVAAAATEAGARALLDDLFVHSVQALTFPGSGGQFTVAFAYKNVVLDANGAHAGLERDVPTLGGGMLRGGTAASVTLARPPLFLADYIADPRLLRYVPTTATAPVALTTTALKETMFFLSRRVLVVLPAPVRAGLSASRLPPRVSNRMG